VKATFFLIGQSAQAHPDLARRELADGHTIGNHTFSHALLNHLTPMAAEAQIDRGFAAIAQVLRGATAPAPKISFFRFPGFASTPALLRQLQQRGIIVFGADLWASDWNRMSPGQELALVLARIEAKRGGIVLLHDTKAQTAAMLPDFLRALRQRGYRIVQAVPATRGLVGAQP
jgi:peptidoglycan/xylan/chitin deacetylase (PgdA/CDA1 family)